uniref:Aminopeptidase n=1 Tax=Podarcis muralis TaxID=64176 RepID=A0A670KE08_PODMU
MAKGFFISRTLGIVGIVLAVAAVATIIALAVVYAEEKQNAATPSVPGTTANPNDPWNQMRLPKTLEPVHYDVTLQPFLTQDAQGLYVFTGNSTVQFVCVEPTDLILIHSKKLSYTEQAGNLVSLRGVNGSTAPAISRTWLQENTEYLVVQLSGSLQQNASYELLSSFRGELADDLAGFYRSEYMEDGVRKVVATTQMQAADARKAFPCFDEPAMKATFTIVLIHPSDHVALSNMPVQSKGMQLDGQPWNRTVFHPTLKMSTYLLAFIVSQFDYVQREQNNTLVGVAVGETTSFLWALGALLARRDFWAPIPGRDPRPCSHADQVALPDFNAGAMENWGLLTYRENSLLFDPLFSSIGNKERVLTVIAHEVAHQWFGNLVTLRWWNDLWLNEGFASYVEYLGADAAEPTWDIKDLMVSSEMYRVMAIDALASSHPLSFPEAEINTPAQISEVFDAIAYSKLGWGASISLPLSLILLLFSLQSYFQAFAYGNTVYDDLWHHLQWAVDEDRFELPGTVKEIMDRWTLQMGFPVVTVDTATGSLTQKHFLLDQTSVVNRSSQFNYTWIVPVSSMKSDNPIPLYWLTSTTAQNSNFSIGADPNTWLLLNINVTGYFRVNYDQGNWDRLLDQLKTDHQVKIPILNRAQLIDDSFNLARANYTSTELALNTTLYLGNERDYLPWSAALSNLGYFQLMFDRSQVYGPMQKYIQKQVTPLFNYYKNLTANWTKIPDGLMDQYNEISAINTACSFGISECQNLASDLFNTWMNDPSNNPIAPNLRSAIYCSAISTGGEEAWDFGWQMFLNATVVSEADKLRSALACSQEPWILQRYLEFSLDPTKIRRQDATSTIISISRNVVGQGLVWDFVRANWKTLFDQYGGGSFSFSNLIQAVTQRFASDFELRQLEQFKADNADVGFGSGTRALEQALEKTKANIQWVAANKEPALKWFQSQL